MASETIVHVIDDDEAIRSSLEFLLRSADLDVVTYESAARFLEALPNLRPGCIITDVRMSGMDGIALLRHLRAVGNQVPVIVITGHGDVPLAVQAMKFGAIDFFEKPFDDDALITSVKSALEANERVAHQETERAESLERLAQLSSRERQVLDGLVAGAPNKVIAYDLGISPRTVEIYRANLMTKMQAQSLPHLVRMALSAGVLAREK